MSLIIVNGKRYTIVKIKEFLMPTTLDITHVLKSCTDGESEGLAEIYSAVYDQLKSLARKQLQQSWSNNTISTTVLGPVHTN